jgi:hypothetical protein
MLQITCRSRFCARSPQGLRKGTLVVSPALCKAAQGPQGFLILLRVSKKKKRQIGFTFTHI